MIQTPTPLLVATFLLQIIKFGSKYFKCFSFIFKIIHDFTRNEPSHMSEEIWFNMSSKAIGYQSFHMVVYVFVCQLSKTADYNDLKFWGMISLGLQMVLGWKKNPDLANCSPENWK